MNILIVDDSKAMRMIVRKALREAGYHGHEIKEASDGSSALAVVHSDPVDMIMCDWNMPGMNGLELLQALKKEERAIKFGFVTSECTADMRLVAETAGAQFMITKPFTPDSFRRALDPLLA